MPLFYTFAFVILFASILVLVRDVIGRMRASRERERLIQELDAFAHTVAHDLKTPLAQVGGFAALLADEMEHGTEIRDEHRDYARRIQMSANKMTEIIDSLLILAGVREVDEVPVEALDTARIVTEAHTRLQHTIEKVQAEVTVQESWPGAVGFAPWVEEVWANYLSNALKYGGQPRLVTLGADPARDGLVRFWVRDNGRGLSVEEQDQLFEAFTRLKRHETSEGHGLGLAIVRRIVEKLGGNVGVESAAGEGCTFWFTLPAARSNQNLPDAHPMSSSVKSEA